METRSTKVMATVMTAVVSAALLVGITFASEVSSDAVNAASVLSNPGGRLHDDFNGRNKDIYVENFSQEDIFARIRLEEFFEIIVNHGTAQEKSYPIIGSKTLKDGAVKDPENNPAGQDLYDYQYVLHQFNTADNKAEDAGICDGHGISYWTWTLGGQTTYMPTFNRNTDSTAADQNGAYMYGTGGISSRENGQYRHYVDYSNPANATLSGFEIYDSDANDVDELAADGVSMVDVFHEDANISRYVASGYISVVSKDSNGHPLTHTAKKTLPARVMSMGDWQTMVDAAGGYDQTLHGNCWVYDTDGWVYWSAPIAGDTATGLLIDGIKLNRCMDDSWYYAINVIAQFITADDPGKLDGTGFYDPADEYADPTPEAEELLEDIGVQFSQPQPSSLTVDMTHSSITLTDDSEGYNPMLSNMGAWDWDYVIDESSQRIQLAAYDDDGSAIDGVTWSADSEKITVSDDGIVFPAEPFEITMKSTIEAITVTATAPDGAEGTYTVYIYSSETHYLGEVFLIGEDVYYIFGYANNPETTAPPSIYYPKGCVWKEGDPVSRLSYVELDGSFDSNDDFRAAMAGAYEGTYTGSYRSEPCPHDEYLYANAPYLVGDGYIDIVDGAATVEVQRGVVYDLSYSPYRISEADYYCDGASLSGASSSYVTLGLWDNYYLVVDENETASTLTMEASLWNYDDQTATVTITLVVVD